MASIPEEIWLQIFKLVQNARPNGTAFYNQIDRDRARAAFVRPLTETCRTFHRICLPLLFETIVMDGFSDEGSRRARCLADVLHRKAHLKRMVFRVHIHWMDYAGKELRDRIEGVIVGLCSVRDMRIDATDLSARLLGQHPRLERLVLTGVCLDQPGGLTIHSFDSLKYLRCDRGGFEDPISFISTALVMPQLETLQIDAIYLTGALSSQIFRFNPAVLKKIIIESQDRWNAKKDEGLVELLQRASRIKSLELSPRRVWPSCTLPDDTIPDLEAFTGLADCVLAFCKGRPVRDLHTGFTAGFTWLMTEEVPNLIRPGSVPLEHLQLDCMVWEYGTIEYIARHCPQLVSLKIGACGRLGNGKITTRHPMPRLRHATFRSLTGSGQWYEDDDDGSMAEKEDKLLQESREFWPKLEHLRLHPEYFWTHRDLEGGWIRVKVMYVE